MYATVLEAGSPLCPLRTCAAPVDQRNIQEVDLVRRVRAGDELAFRELVERYKLRVYRVAYRILRNPEDADEIAQEAFAKVYFSFESFDGRSSLYTWIYRIAVNECYSFLRQKRLKLVSETDFPDGTLQTIPDAHPTADEDLAQRDLLNKLLARLPEDDRLLLLWKEVEGFSIAQISKLTGLNDNTIKVRLFRARRRLAEAAARLDPRRRKPATISGGPVT